MALPSSGRASTAVETIALVENRHRQTLFRILQADESLQRDGREPEAFHLRRSGGMKQQVEHPCWDRSWPVPGPQTIDDLGEVGFLRVDPSRDKSRTFSLTMKGRSIKAPAPEHIALDVSRERAWDPPAPERADSDDASATGLRDHPALDEAPDPATVMVVHGQDQEAADALFDWLRAIGLRPREWAQLVQAEGSGSPFIGKVLDQAFRDAQAVVVLFTPDERAAIREELGGGQPEWRLQARPNVLLEAGMAFATHPQRTVLVVLGDQALPSDLAGRHYVTLGTIDALQDLAQRLEAAGCPVDRSGSHWLNPGRFPTRPGLPGKPPSSAAAPALRVAGEQQVVAYQKLLAAHEQLVHANSQSGFDRERVEEARTAFAQAQTSVIFYGSEQARIAAEQLRTAWQPTSESLHLGSASRWRPAVEAARSEFVSAIMPMTSPR